MMTDNKEIRVQNWEKKQGDKHARTKAAWAIGKNFAPLRHWIVESYRTLAVVTLNTIILFACLELAAVGILEIRSLFSTSTEQLVGEGAPREKNSYYVSKDWAAQYWHEFRLSRQERYYPYVGWRRDSFKGKTINIDQHGIRLTPGADCSANSYKVFAFGGSTMWGTGAPDWGTIPAYLQIRFQALTTRPVCVVNFGESAYVSTQSLIELLEQLQLGNAPDIVLFYDGVNDVYAAYQSGQAGVHQNLDQIGAKFQGGSSNRGSPLIEWLHESSLVALFKTVIAGPKQKPQQGEKVMNYETLKIDKTSLVGAVAQTYLTNYKVVTALAHEYGFKFAFFWQPVIVAGKKPLTDEEQTITESLDPASVALYTSFYDIIENTAPHYENLYYMGHIFDEQNSEIWIDDMHVTPLGNQIVAAKMLSVVGDADHLPG